MGWVRRLRCRLFGHPDTERWYAPWDREPTTGRWLNRRTVYDVCTRCRVTVSDSVEVR